MHLIDLHCDTLYKSVTQNILLDDSSMECKPETDDKSHKLQCYAIWLPDNLSEAKAESLFYSAYKKLIKEADRLNIRLLGNSDSFAKQFDSNVNSAYFTVENGSALNGKLENVKKFAELGVKIITLTWNGRNSLGDGAMVKCSKGITEFGRLAVKEMVKYGIIPDISHASDKLFYDVAEISEGPIIATHSNSRHVTGNSRNLTDEQIKIITDKNGIIGLNFHNAFLNDKPDKATMLDILKHTEHFMSVGAENNLCIGTDFDGCTLPNDIRGSESMQKIYEMFLKHNYKESVINKIFYKNAKSFFENLDNQRIKQFDNPWIM